jgi:MurNAc alpha-1-phosphate uridylyltransferase
MTISQALIMAAGYATRMRPLTDTLPKPLLEVRGKPLLTHIIHHLDAEDVTKIVINGYHAIAPLKHYIKDIAKHYPHIEFILSEETELLETGGGAVQALKYLDNDNPFYMINGDAFWINPKNSQTLRDLKTAWNSEAQDMILLLQSCQSMNMATNVGDYEIDNLHAVRSKTKNGTHIFAGVRICMPHIIKPYALENFSFLKIMDACEQNKRLGALSHKGEWYHISTPQDLDMINAIRKQSLAT